MPWTVQIEDEDGCLQDDIRPTIEFSLIFSIPDFSLLPHIAASGLLKYLDPWGDTVFNRVQMKDLRQEWGTLIPPEAALQGWTRVMQMIDICSEDTHRYLRFIGD